MADIVLSKQSTINEIKAYFNFVVRIVEANKDEYPINLDDVWALVYGRKSDAVEALTKDFIQDVDYQVLRQNPQNSLGGRPTNDYHLTASCFEFFIARKVRPVFEVYRQVFHKTRAMLLQRSALPKNYADALRQLADTVEEKERAQLLLAEKTEQLDESKEWYSIKRWAQMHRKNWRSYKWRVLKALSAELGYEVKKIFDANYEEVKIYHKDVFEAAYGE